MRKMTKPFKPNLVKMFINTIRISILVYFTETKNADSVFSLGSRLWAESLVSRLGTEEFLYSATSTLALCRDLMLAT